MSRLNDEFMEAFKHIDKICKEMYSSNNGVTTYIETMERTPGGSSYVSNWDLILKTLKDYRHIRNQYAHEVGSSYNDICNQQDVDWLNNFYESLMNTTDPLAMYQKHISAMKKPKASLPKQPTISYNEIGNFSYSNQSNTKVEQNKKDASLVAAVCFVCVAVAAAVCIYLFWL